MSVAALSKIPGLRSRGGLGAMLVLLAQLPACNDEHQRDSLVTDGAAGEPGTLGAGSDRGGEDAADRFLREYAASVCVLYRPCCLSEGRGYDGAGCTEWFHDTFRAQVGGEFREDAAEHCLVALADAAAQDPERCSAVTSFNEATLRGECAAVFVPLARSGASLGEQCNIAAQCASSALGEVNCFENRCLLQRRGSEGEGPCVFSTRLVEEEATEVVTCEMRDALYCHLEDDVCARLGEVGEACAHLGACKAGTICLQGRCQRLPERGEACLNTTPGLCAPGSACDETHARCGPALAAGQACSDSFACASGSCRGGLCADPEFFARLSCTGED